MVAGSTALSASGPGSQYQQCISTSPVRAGTSNQPVITLVGPRVTAQPLGTSYLNRYPPQLAAIAPLSGGYGTVSGCLLKETPAWAFNG